MPGVGNFSSDLCGPPVGNQPSLETESQGQKKAATPTQLRFDRGLIDQHDRDIFFYGVDAVAPMALQAFGILPVLERLLVFRAHQDFQKFFIDHDGSNCTTFSSGILA